MCARKSKCLFFPRGGVKCTGRVLRVLLSTLLALCRVRVRPIWFTPLWVCFARADQWAHNSRNRQLMCQYLLGSKYSRWRATVLFPRSTPRCLEVCNRVTPPPWPPAPPAATPTTPPASGNDDKDSSAGAPAGEGGGEGERDTSVAANSSMVTMAGTPPRPAGVVCVGWVVPSLLL